MLIIYKGIFLKLWSKVLHIVLIIFFIFQQLTSQISKIDLNGYNTFCKFMNISKWHKFSWLQKVSSKMWMFSNIMNSAQVQHRAVLFQLFPKTVNLPPKPVGFRFDLYSIIRHIFLEKTCRLTWITPPMYLYLGHVMARCCTDMYIPSLSLKLWPSSLDIYGDVINFPYVFKGFSNISVSLWIKTVF